MTEPFRLVAVSGNLQRPSRSFALAEVIGHAMQRHAPVSFEHYDVAELGAGLGAALARSQLSSRALAVVEAIEQSDALIVTTPVYKGGYTGLLKHLIDFVDMNALVERPVIIGATGGGSRHALMVEHQLRPLFGFFSALTMPTAIYADDRSFENYQQSDPGVLARIEMAATQLAAALASRAPRRLDLPVAHVADNVITLKEQRAAE